MNTLPTPYETTRAGLRDARENVYVAYWNLGQAVAAHLAAMVREIFPTAVALVLKFPDKGIGAAKLDSVLGPAPSAIATNPVLCDNSGDDDEDDPIDEAWPYAVGDLEDLAQEYAEITHTDNWPWCDTDGRFRILNFPPETNDTEPEKPQVEG